MTEKTTIKLELEIPEINFILETLGELPSKTSAYILMMKIKEQGEPQVPQEQKAPD